jgi:hypothetical protein
MKWGSVMAVCLLALASMNLRAQDDDEVFPPQSIPADRYEFMMRRSPFVLPTREAEKPTAPNWTSDYQIVSVLKIGGEAVVLARKLSTNERIPIQAKENAQGIRLISLQMSPDPREVFAVLEMNGAEGTIQYDPSILSGLPRSVAPDNPAIKSE